MTSHTHRIGPAGLYFQPFLDPHLVLPEIAEIVLIQEAFIDAKVQVGQLDFPCIVAAEPAEAWHGVVFLANALRLLRLPAGPSRWQEDWTRSGN